MLTRRGAALAAAAAAGAGPSGMGSRLSVGTTGLDAGDDEDADSAPDDMGYDARWWWL